MPTLDIFSFSVEEPTNIVVRQVMSTLRAVKDVNNQNINLSVEYGLDSVLWDVMYGGASSNSDLFPMIRVFASPGRKETDDGLTGIAGTNTMFSLYFLYYIGVPSQDVVRVSFQEARNNHIRTNLDALRADRCVPFADTICEAWRWLTDEESGGREQDDETPFKYLDATYQLTPRDGFTCSRVDWPFWVKGELAYPLSPVY